LEEFKSKAEELEKENLELATQLAKKEADLDVKTQEKEDIESNLER
jgi:dishevelled associated activator of morphogenesis